jgi:DNA-binding transcriptional MerR regulator
MENALPAIPPKRYFTIGEVSELCGVKPYVLRYWEQEFTQLRPMKRRGNRRYYQHHEVLLIRRIRDLLYEQGFTISGARNRLSEVGAQQLVASLDDDDEGEGEFLASTSSPGQAADLAPANPPVASEGTQTGLAAVAAQAPLDAIHTASTAPATAQDTVHAPAAAHRAVPASLLSLQILRSELQLIKELLTPGQDA